MTQPAPEMPPKPTAEVSEDTDTVTEDTGQAQQDDTAARIQANAIAMCHQLSAANIHLQHENELLKAERDEARRMAAAVQQINESNAQASIRHVAELEKLRAELRFQLESRIA